MQLSSDRNTTNIITENKDSCRVKKEELEERMENISKKLEFNLNKSVKF